MDSMEEIYLQYAKTVYGFLLSKTRDPDQAEDLTQETFLQAIKSVGRFRGGCSVSTWLCSIAKNLWHHSLRKHNAEVDLTQAQLPPDISAEQRFFDSWEQTRILQLLHKMPEPTREVMCLRLVGDLSFRQIGAIMERNETWARVTFYRGKEKLIREASDNADKTAL